MIKTPTQETPSSLRIDGYDTRIGVIDIGSNSVRFVVYEVFGAAATPILNEKILAGLGRSLRIDGKLYAPGRAQTLKALHRFKALAEAHELDHVSVVATAAVREASDGAEFIAQVKAQTGIEITCLSGLQEAEMAAYGVISGDHRARGIVADLGGASLELIHVKDAAAGQGCTLPLGPFVMMDDGFDPVDLRARVNAELEKIAPEFLAQDETLYLVGGAWRNLALIHNARRGYPLSILQNFSMKPEDGLWLGRWAAEEAASDLLKWPGIPHSRAETLPYSGVVLQALIAQLKPKHVVVSPSGLREGLLYSALDGQTQQRDALFDACRHLASGNEQISDFGGPLYEWLSEAALSFPISLDPHSEDRIRQAACYLVGMGKGLHPDHRAALVFADVLYAPLSGLTHKERAYLALILYSSFTKSSRTPNDAAMNYFLLEREKKAARIYGTAIRLASVISSRSPDLLKYFSLSVEDSGLQLNVADGHEELLNRRGELRLKRLADMAGHEWSTNRVAAV